MHSQGSLCAAELLLLSVLWQSELAQALCGAKSRGQHVLSVSTLESLRAMPRPCRSNPAGG